MSVRQHSGAFNVHQSVTAYLLNQSVQCAAQGCNSLQQGMSYMRSMYDPDQRNHWIPYCPLNPTSGVLVLRFPRTSHQPVTFCAFHKAVLIPVFAFRCFNCIYYRRVHSLLSTTKKSNYKNKGATSRNSFVFYRFPIFYYFTFNVTS